MILDDRFMCNKPVAILTDANFRGGLFGSSVFRALTQLSHA